MGFLQGNGFLGGQGGDGGSGGGGSDVKVINNLTSTSTTDALSAYQGNILSKRVATHSDVIASTTVLGHVKIDGVTLDIDSDGVLSVVGGSSENDGSVNYFQGVLPTAEIGQTKWKIPLTSYNPTKDLTIVSHNNLLLSNDMYNISNKTGENILEITSKIPSPIAENKVSIIVIMGASSGGAVIDIDGKNIIDGTVPMSKLSIDVQDKILKGGTAPDEVTIVKKNDKLQVADNITNQLHSHTNKPLLDQLEDTDGDLSYRGTVLGQIMFMTVFDIAERNAIPMEKRNEGLFVLCSEDGSSYYLKGGTDNAFWTLFGTGTGGATSASQLPAQPSGELVGTDTQSLIDELEAKKMSMSDAYTKSETDEQISNHVIEYNNIANKPDLSTLHSHNNKDTLDKFTEYQGGLVWDGKKFGDMVVEVFDKNGDGVIDEAMTLKGLTATVPELNHMKGATSNIQDQINAISQGTVFRGVFATFNILMTTYVPSKGDWVFIANDETHNNARTQYIYDGAKYVFGGGATEIAEATKDVIGGILLGGDLANPNGTGKAPQLSTTGVQAGLYKNANILVDEKGRITYAESGAVAFINDAVVSPTETWSSQKMTDQLFNKAEKNHTHAQLHDANKLGKTTLDESALGNKKVITYNAVKGVAEWSDAQGGKVMVGSKFIEGDYRLVAGAYTNLQIDEVAKTITINNTFRDGVNNGVATLTEITGTVNVPSGATVRKSFDATFNKYMVNTIRISNTENMVIDASIYETAIGGEYEYLSNKGNKLHDILSLPITDVDQTKKIHLEFHNYGTADTVVVFKIKTTNLI